MSNTAKNIHTDDVLQSAAIVQRLISEVWNGSQLDLLDELLSADYVDHNLPPTMIGVEGVKQWIAATSAAFEHHTQIEDQVTEGNKSVVRITFKVKHIGEWRGIPATGASVQTTGYRMYRIESGKIVEHWALIDGDSLESQLKKFA